MGEDSGAAPEGYAKPIHMDAFGRTSYRFGITYRPKSFYGVGANSISKHGIMVCHKRVKNVRVTKFTRSGLGQIYSPGDLRRVKNAKYQWQPQKTTQIQKPGYHYHSI